MAIVNQEPVITSSWRPSLKKSSDPDQDIKDTENRQYEMEFSSDFNRYRKREEVYENNIVKSYALFWEKCTVGMKNKIQGRTDFKSKIENNPFELLNSIKEHSMNYQENQYEYSIILDSMITLLTTKQKEGENLQDYTKRFWISKELCESHIGGPIVLFKTLVDNKAYKVEATDQMEHEKNRKLQEQAFEQLLAYTYLKHADQSKYGSIIEGLVTQKSLKNDQYPKTITEANNVLSNHRFDTPKISSRFQQSKGSSDIGRREPEAEKINLSFAQMDGKCYCCGKPGHKSPQCRLNNRPKAEWAINKSQQSHAQASKAAGKAPDSTKAHDNNQNERSSTHQVSEGWAGVHYQLYQQDTMKDWILLDNESTVTIFCNPDLVSDIQEVKGESLDLVTNAGVLRTTQKASIPGWGKAWYNPHAITNIFSYAEMAQKHRITYDSATEDAFIVHLPDKKVRFNKTDQGLYIFKPKITKNNNQMQFLNTVDENKHFFTRQQFARAKLARELYNALGTPSLADFKAIIRMNLIVNNPITQKDIDIAESIFGPEIGSLKGKTIRKTPIPVIDDFIELPRELFEQQEKIVHDF